MTDILQLPGWEVSKTYEDATERTIEAAFTEPADAWASGKTDIP